MDHSHDERRNRRLAGLMGIPLALTILGGAYETSEGRIEKDLNRRTEALAKGEGFDIKADYSGQDAHITCVAPGTDIAALKKLLIDTKGPQNPDGNKAPFIDEASCAAAPAPEPAPEPEPAPTDPPAPVSEPAPTDPPTPVSEVAAPAVTEPAKVSDVEAAAVLASGSTKITLQSEAQRAALVAAAGAEFGPEDVIDELVVDPAGVPTAETDELVNRMGELSKALNGRMSEGEAGIKGGRLYLRGTYLSPAAKTELDTTAADLGVETADVAIVPLPAATVECATDLTAELNALVAANPIPFQPSKADLTAEAPALLDQVAALALKCGAAKIEVQGHTDGDGSDASNQALSQRRADVVLAALVERGVPAEQLVATGFGESQPVAPNDTPENKAKNRRVVFAVAAQ
jgi:outer membrane protein OmpA-like peptidoglycan-associated protein